MNFMYSGLSNSTIAINNELTLFSKPIYYTSFLFNNERQPYSITLLRLHEEI